MALNVCALPSRAERQSVTVFDCIFCQWPLCDWAHSDNYRRAIVLNVCIIFIGVA